MLALAARAGTPLRLVERLPGGAYGAWLVRDAHGRDRVLKWLARRDGRARVEGAAAATAELRRRGYPAPEHGPPGYDVGVGTWWLQERMPGEAAQQLTHRLLDQLEPLIELQGEAQGETPPGLHRWTDQVRAEVLEHRSGWAAAALDHGGEAAAIADAITTAVAPHARAGLREGDIVHGDLVVTQILVDGGRVTGVVDWGAAGAGDRGQDVALLLFNLHAQALRGGYGPDESLARRLAGLLRALAGDGGATVLIAYHVLAMLGFVVPRNPAALPWRCEQSRRVLRSAGLWPARARSRAGSDSRSGSRDRPR